MNRRTTEYLSNRLTRRLEDDSTNNYPTALRIDIINRALEDLVHILIAVHKEGYVGIQWPWKILDKDEFSGHNCITLPNDYMTWIELRNDGTDDLIEIMAITHLDDEDRTEDLLGSIFSSNVSAPLPNSSNSGLDDMQVDGIFTGTANAVYTVTIASATTFNWSASVGGGSGTGVTMTGEWQTLEKGIQVKFPSATGYTTGESWTFTGYIDRDVQVLRLNAAPESDVRLTYVRVQTDISALSASEYLPFPRFYSVLEDICAERMRAWNEEDISIEKFLDVTAMQRARNIMRHSNANERLRRHPKASTEEYL